MDNDKQEPNSLLTKIRKRKKISTILGIVLIIIAIITGRRIYQSLKPPVFETVRVERRDLRKTIEVSGGIEAREAVNLHFPTLGRLSWVGVKEGDRVDPWQAVASQDKRTLENQLKQDLIAFEKEYRDFDQTVEDNPLVNDRFRRILEKAQFDLDNEVIDVEIRNLAIELATLVTPIGGIVTRVDTPVAGVNVTAADTITIVNPETLYFEAEVDETDIAQVSVGDKATILLDAYEDRELDSEITRIDFSASTSDGGGTVFLVRMSLPAVEEMQFFLGLNGDASIIVDEKPQVLSLQFEAVDEDEKGAFVIVYENGSFLKRPVETGLETEDNIEVVSGLTEGDEAVLPGSIEGAFEIDDVPREGS